jgi:NIPSNAP
MSFELRIYHANPGKIELLLARFRDHTDKILAHHGIQSIGYWVDDTNPLDLIYIVKHAGDPVVNWQRFVADPEWIDVKAKSEINGSLVASIESRYMVPTDFSRIK